MGLNTGSKAARAIQEILNDPSLVVGLMLIAHNHHEMLPTFVIFTIPEKIEILRYLRALNC